VCVGTIDTSGQPGTNASTKNHIDVKMKKNMTPPVATLRRKYKGKRTLVIDVVKIGLQAIDVHPITHIIAKL
jgi:hypothetical protein